MLPQCVFPPKFVSVLRQATSAWLNSAMVVESVFGSPREARLDHNILPNLLHKHTIYHPWLAVAQLE